MSHIKRTSHFKRASHITRASICVTHQTYVTHVTSSVTHGIGWNETSKFHDPCVDGVPSASLDLVVRRAASIVTRIRTPDARRHDRHRHRRRRHRVDADARRDGPGTVQNVGRTSDDVKLAIEGTRQNRCRLKIWKVSLCKKRKKRKRCKSV